MRASIVVGVGISLALLLTSCAQKTPSSAGPPPSGTIAENAVQVTATVVKVDPKTRHLSLKLPDGQVVAMTVPEEMRNLPQVKKGDVVVATYVESLAYEVKKPGTAEPGVAVAGVAGRAEPGQKPAGAAANAVTVTTTITGIDKKAGTVTLQGPDGESTTIKVRNPANLDRVSKGDLVEITYSESVAVSVEPAPAK